MVKSYPFPFMRENSNINKICRLKGKGESKEESYIGKEATQ